MARSATLRRRGQARARCRSLRSCTRRRARRWWRRRCQGRATRQAAREKAPACFLLRGGRRMCASCRLRRGAQHDGCVGLAGGGTGLHRSGFRCGGFFRPRDADVLAGGGARRRIRERLAAEARRGPTCLLEPLRRAPPRSALLDPVGREYALLPSQNERPGQVALGLLRLPELLRHAALLAPEAGEDGAKPVVVGGLQLGAEGLHRGDGRRRRARAAGGAHRHRGEGAESGGWARARGVSPPPGLAGAVAAGTKLVTVLAGWSRLVTSRQRMRQRQAAGRGGRGEQQRQNTCRGSQSRGRTEVQEAEHKVEHRGRTEAEQSRTGRTEVEHRWDRGRTEAEVEQR